MNCISFAIDEEINFKDKLIPHFIDGDINQFDPFYSNFKRIKCIDMNLMEESHWTQILQLIDKASIRIDSLSISDSNFQIMSEFYRDKNVNFIVDEFKLNYDLNDYVSKEDIEFLNKINPSFLSIDWITWTYENIIAIALLNILNINVRFKNDFIGLCELSFLNTQVQVIGSESRQGLSFDLEEITFLIIIEKAESVKLCKKNDIDCLFIPSEIVYQLTISGLK